VKKTLFVGVFAYIIGNWNSLARIVFESFAGLGLKASGTGFTAAELLQPGRVAQVGLEAGQPILQSISDLMGWVAFLENFIQIAVLLIAWLLVILAFFILSIQLFVTLIEFKLATLCGFVLIPFGLFGKTAFMAERVLGLVISSGVKVLVLAVIVGIGSGFFTEFASALQGKEPDIGQAMSLVLASLALFGLGIFGPGIASGLVSGAPQLGAGSAVATTALAAGGFAVAGGAGVAAAKGLAGAGLGAIRAGTSMGSAASTAYKLGQETSGSKSVATGMGGIATAARGALAQRMGSGLALRAAAADGQRAAWNAGTTGARPNPGGAPAPASNAMPGWARDLQNTQSRRHHRQAAIHALQGADRGGGGATPDIKEKD